MRRILTALALIMCLPAGGEVYYKVSFYLLPGLYYANSPKNLAAYVDDLNYILSKNTNARLTFDPKDIYFIKDHPYEGGYLGTLPTAFEVGIYAERSDSFCNGTMNTDPANGNLQIDGGGPHRAMCWDKIHDPLSSDLDVNSYSYQLETILHELGHGFGIMPEYYWFAVVADTTGQAPILNVNFWDPQDPYWSTHPGIMNDPMMHGVYDPVRINTREKVLDTVEYMDLSAQIINDVLRNYWETADRVFIHVVDSAGNPVEGATVDMWTSPDNTISHTTQLTGETGVVSFEWFYPRINAVSSARLIKAYKGGDSAVRFITVLDSDIARLINGQDTLEIDIPLLPGDPGHNCGPDHQEGCAVPVLNNMIYLPLVGISP